MKTIKLYSTTYDIRTLYRKANTQAQRALVGYIIKAGMTHDTIFGGAFKLLCDVERCMNDEEIYEIYSLEDNETKAKIKHIAQLALDGKFDCFTIRKADMEATVRAMADF